MPTIRSGAGIVTQINTFTVAEANQEALFELLTEAADFSREVRAGYPPACTGAWTGPVS